VICPFSNSTCTELCPVAMEDESGSICSAPVIAIALASIADVLRYHMLGGEPEWRFLLNNEIAHPEEEASRPEGTRGQDGPDATGATNGDGTRGGEAK
jgi:hypothetical protein